MPEATSRPPPSLTDVIVATVLPMRCPEFFMMDVLLVNNVPVGIDNIVKRRGYVA